MAKCNGKVHENYRLFITDNSSVENLRKLDLSTSLNRKDDKHKSNNTKKRKTFY